MSNGILQKSILYYDISLCETSSCASLCGRMRLHIDTSNGIGRSLALIDSEDTVIWSSSHVHASPTPPDQIVAPIMCISGAS
jgi:hypothetical protein